MLGAGLYILNSTVTVPADSALCVTGRDTVSSADITRLLPPATPGQLHFQQYGGLLQLKSLQLEGRATDSSAASSGGGVVIRRSANGTEDDGQPATFAALTVTFKSISPRAVANDDDPAASLTFVNSTFLDNINTYRNNTGLGGCGISLDEATASFAATAPAQFIGNSAPTGGIGMALRVWGGSVVFRGPVLMADNWARSGAGGAVHLYFGSNLTFDNTAALRNNRILIGPRNFGIGGGAIYASASHITHNAAAMYINNRAGRQGGTTGGAVCLDGWVSAVGNTDCHGISGTRSSFSASQHVTFLNNTANKGGALHPA
ncbi:hypothetical protein OEZ86_000821 [Tetradesmus obliquus]|nr:hypothetical protein OEZ86_000821 [Tetradesmus obliquus]